MAGNIAPFVRVEDVRTLLPILQSRLPRSSHIYNMAIMYPKYTTEMNFYTLNAALTPTTWIVATYDREDYGKDINISAPSEPVLSSEVKDAFTNSALFDWDKLYNFNEIDREISPMIFEISALVKGNSTKFTPCYMYYLSREECLELDTRQANSEIEIKSLNTCLKAGAQFMYDTCEHKTDGSMTFIETLIKRSPSAGIFLNGQLISGAMTVANGPMGFLFTLEEHRNQNFGKLSMLALMKEQAKEGFAPCSIVEFSNSVSNAFHLKIGMRRSHVLDYMIGNAKG